MTEQNILVYKLFLSLNIPDFSLFNLKLATPLKKVTHLFPSNPPLKIEVLSTPPLFENLVGGSTPLPRAEKGGGGARYANIYQQIPSNNSTNFKLVHTGSVIPDTPS